MMFDFLKAFRSARNPELQSYFKAEYRNDWEYAYTNFLNTKQLHPKNEKFRI